MHDIMTLEWLGTSKADATNASHRYDELYDIVKAATRGESESSRTRRQILSGKICRACCKRLLSFKQIRKKGKVTLPGERALALAQSCSATMAIEWQEDVVLHSSL